MSRPGRQVQAMRLLVLCGATIVACSNDSTSPRASVASVEITPAAPGVVIGHTAQLTAIVRDAAGNELAGRSVTWRSEAPTRATVSTTGLVTGLVLGDGVQITAISEGWSGSAMLSVVLDIAGEWNYTEQVGRTYQGRAVTCSDTGSYQLTQSVAGIGGTAVWVGECEGPFAALADEAVAPYLVTEGRLHSAYLDFRVGGCVYGGDVTGPPAPKLSGTLTCGDWTGTWEAVPGGQPVASVTVRSDVQTVVGGIVQLIAVPRDAAGHVLSRTVRWSSDHPSVATVSDTGLVAALTPGSARISALSEGQTGSAGVTAELVSFGSVSAGVYHTCGLTTSGAAYCWGWAGNGQLGLGFRPPAHPLGLGQNDRTPLAVAGGHTFTMVSGGLGHSCGVTTAGEAYCWGDNTYGQLGDGSKTRSLAPVSVTGGQQFASVTAGSYHSCGVTTGNALYCWGNNSQEQLGDGSHTSSSSPVLVAGDFLFQAARAGAYHTCGVTTANVAYCWGYDLDGQLGTGSVTFNVPTPVAVAGDHSFAAVATGFSHSCGTATDGAAYCWGQASLLGDESGLDQYAPVAVAGGITFATAGGSLASGQESSCALTPSSAAYCWGHNDAGQLGDGSTTWRSTPNLVLGGLSFASISTGPFHTCGVTTSAVAYCWGINANGQVGATVLDECVADATYPCALAPVRVVGTVQAGASAARVLGRAARPRTADRAALLRELEASLRRTPLSPLPLKAP